MKKFFNSYPFFIVFLLIVIYILFFLKYYLNIYNLNFSNNTNANIVVLTGGIGRIQAGIKLLSNNKDKKLLISGVGKGVSKSEILLKDFSLYYKRVDLGYEANSTLGNAVEAKAWIKKNKLYKIILVSDNWHLPRAKLLFQAAMPEIEIVTHPVREKILHKNILFLIQEHFKYIISHFQKLYLSYWNS